MQLFEMLDKDRYDRYDDIQVGVEFESFRQLRIGSPEVCEVVRRNAERNSWAADHALLQGSDTIARRVETASRLRRISAWDRR